MSLSIDQALACVEGCRQRAKEMSVNMSICVCDAAGRLVAFARMDGVGLMTIDIAQRKAYSAAALRNPTRAVAEKLANNPVTAMSLMHGAPGLILLGGGVPIRKDGQVIGGVGCSGGSADQDHEVAEAGIAKVT